MYPPPDKDQDQLLTRLQHCLTPDTWHRQLKITSCWLTWSGSCLSLWSTLVPLLWVRNTNLPILFLFTEKIAPILYVSPYQWNHFLCEGHYRSNYSMSASLSGLPATVVFSSPPTHPTPHPHITTQLTTTTRPDHLLWSPHKCQYGPQCVAICGEGRC